MGNPRAKANVVLTDPETGAVRVFEVGEELTDWAVEMIDNPEVLGDSEPDESPAAEPKPTRTRRPRKAPTK
ncbi:hypothetical protein [Paenarthrobacter sp. YJN-5]|uniref:hypothetical protein n=1 Tax=Paenarthrobacter sp. YJN-5 TaxID=2735316 RepID=UPI001877D78E|nr:hypothetical protein [Paenarthrobacter sp. YJN-5]QOT19729.1 hypothetical protein HMI59_24010 [Paenarthrobacter sp. YJN-5]